MTNTEKVELNQEDIELLKRYTPKAYSNLRIIDNAIVFNPYNEELDELFIDLNFAIVEHGLTPDQNETNELGRELYKLHDKIFIF